MKIARFALVCVSSSPAFLVRAAETFPPNGLGTPAAAVEATDLAALRAKAERGNAIAQYNLGLAYLEGRGTAKDPVEAFVWLTIAAENGSTAKALETLRDGLTPEQIGEAQRRIDALRERVAGLKSAPVTGKPRPMAARGDNVANERAPAAAILPSTTETAQIIRLKNDLERAGQNESQLRSELSLLRERIATTEATSAAAARAQAQVAALTTELAATRADAAKLRIELAAAGEKSAANTKAASREQEMEIARLKAQLDDARQALAKTDERIRQGGEEKARADANANAAAAETVTLREQVRALTAERDATRAERTAATARAAELERALATTREAKSESASAELVAARKDIEAWKGKAAQAAADQAKTASALAAQATELQLLQRARDAARTERDQLQSDLTASRQKLASAEAQLADANSTREQTKKREATAQEALASAVRDRDEALARIQAADMRRQELAAKADAAVAEVAKAEQRATQLAADNEALQRRLSATDANRAAEQSQAKQAAAEELAAARRDLIDSRQKVAAANQEIAAWRTQVAAKSELEARVRQLEAEKAVLARRLDAAGAELDKGAESGREIATVTAARVDAEQKLAVALRSYALLEKERDELAGRLAATAVRPEPPRATVTELALGATPVSPAQREPVGVPLNAAPPARFAASTTRPPTPAETRTASGGGETLRTNVPAASTPSPATGAVPRYHTVALGETLSGIARRYYGTPTRWVEIYEANRDELRDEHTLVAGRTLRIP